jgi:hypothetical protein
MNTIWPSLHLVHPPGTSSTRSLKTWFSTHSEDSLRHPALLWHHIPRLPVVPCAYDSTRPAMDQSRPEPSSPVQVQSNKFLDWDRTDPRCWQTGLGLVRTDPSRCPGLGYTFPHIHLLMGKIYLNGAKYTDRGGLINFDQSGYSGVSSDKKWGWVMFSVVLG